MENGITLDILRSELTQLELRIVDRIANALELKADKAVVAEHDKRIAVLELSRASRDHLPKDLNELERRLVEVEKVADQQNGENTYKKWLLPAVASIVGALWWMPLVLTHHA